VLGGVLAEDIGVRNNELIVGKLVDVSVEVKARVQAKLLEGCLALVPNSTRGNEVDVRVEDVLGARVYFIMRVDEEADGARVTLLFKSLHEEDAHVDVGVAEGDVEVGLVHYVVSGVGL